MNIIMDCFSDKSKSNIIVVLGSQWGDEGKGKLVDLLAFKSDIVCRCQGGNNAGHTVVVNDQKFDFHLLPSGVINERALILIGNGVVIHLPSLFQEIDTNVKKGLLHIESQLRVSDRAHLVLDIHQSIDGLHEQSLGGNSIGTTKKGIGPTYSSKATRNGIRVCDLLSDWDSFVSKYHTITNYICTRYADHRLNVDEDLEKYKALRSRLAPLVVDSVSLLHAALTGYTDSPLLKSISVSPTPHGDRNHYNILVEGAQSSLLDIDFGTYPYVTSSNCSVGGVCTGLGLPPSSITSVFGVVKAYTSRVGDGPFPTELADDSKEGRFLREKGAEFGVTTGRPRRCGWLDTQIVRYANMINGFTAFALTKLDVLDGLEEIKIGVKYVNPDTNEEFDTVPANVELLNRVRVDYETLPGWLCCTSGCKQFDQLPKPAQTYVARVQELIGAPICWIGTGPGRDEIICLPSTGVPS